MSREIVSCCADFSRARLLRQAVAEAGRGLPAIEPGMPLPAGTGMTRRSFVSGVAGLAIAVYGAGSIGPSIFEDGIAAAASSASNSRVLVSIFMDGGADSLSILFPDGDPRYRALRPALALASSSGTPFIGDSRLRWHPAAASLATLHAEGKVTVFPSVGWTGSDGSHFTSRHYWEVGATSVGLRTGWLGRYLDRVGAPDNPLQGLTLGLGLAPSLASSRAPVAATLGPQYYKFKPAGTPRNGIRSAIVDGLGAVGSAHLRSPDLGLRKAGQVAAHSNILRGQLEALNLPDPSAAGYPGGWQKLALLAAMLGAGLPIKCVAITAPGAYDTHANQPAPLADGLKATADGLLAFQRDLERRGIADRVLVHVWSEFGRRARENGSGGTDHGAAGIGFLIGTQATGAMVGEYPGLTSGLDELGNLKATSDFRGIYSGLLEQWLGTDADGIIPNAKSFARPKLVK